jgi:hypothetical protein
LIYVNLKIDLQLCQSASTVQVDADVNYNMINGGAVFRVPITATVPIPYIDNIPVSHDKYREPPTTKAALMLREIDQVTVLEMKEAYMLDSKFSRPLANCFLSRESWAILSKKLKRDPDDSSENLHLSTEQEAEFKADLMDGVYRCVMLEANHRSLGQRKAWEHTTGVLKAALPGQLSNEDKKRLQERAISLAVINLSIFAGTQRSDLDELRLVRTVFSLTDSHSRYSYWHVFPQVAVKSNARENRAMANPESHFVKRCAEVIYSALKWEPTLPLIVRKHLEKAPGGWPVLTKELIRDHDSEKDTYSKSWHFWADVYATVMGDAGQVKEQLKNGVHFQNIGQYYIPLIRWGSTILDKVVAILDSHRNLGYNYQKDDKAIRDAWVEYNTKVFDVWCVRHCNNLLCSWTRCVR